MATRLMNKVNQVVNIGAHVYVTDVRNVYLKDGTMSGSVKGVRVTNIGEQVWRKVS